MILFSLLGEQPTPALLMALHFKPTEHILLCTDLTEKIAKRLQKNFSERVCFRPYKLKSGGYELARCQAEIQELAANQQADSMTFDLTGGTKIMSLAMYAVAQKCSGKAAYLETTKFNSILHTYQLEAQGVGQPIAPQPLPDLMTIEYYLKAYLDGFEVGGFSPEKGGDLEKKVAGALVSGGFEVKAGIRPANVGEQLELDLIVRKNNQIGVVEVKWGGDGNETLKKGLDQLNQLSEQTYLGTYAHRFLVTAKPVKPEIQDLAQAKRVKIIQLPRYSPDRPLSRDDVQLIIQTFTDEMAGNGRRL